MPFTVLIDGDIIAYRCGFAAEKKHYKLTYKDAGCDETRTFIGKTAMNDWLKEHDPDEYSWESELVVEPLHYCLSTVKHMINNIKSATKATSCIIYLSDKENFRDKVATIAK